MGDNDYKRLHKEQGLCSNCSYPSIDGNFCEKHLLTRRSTEKVRNKKQRERYRELGVCITCGHPFNEYFDTTDALNCRNCLEGGFKRWR
jgi:DNA-directed RNA polymerase subunit RPC12/RpoP